MLEPFLQDKLLQRGLYIRFANSRLVGPPLDGIIEHASTDFLVLSFERATKGKSLIGSTIRMDLGCTTYSVQIQLEVVSEESIWPVQLIGMKPIHVHLIEKQQQGTMVKPDYIINIPYNVMGAKPNEEQGEGVILEFSPEMLIVGTDGYVAKGDYLNLSFLIPKKKEQFIGMAKAIDKQFIDGSTRVTLQLTNVEDRYRISLTNYYNKLRKK